LIEGPPTGTSAELVPKGFDYELIPDPAARQTAQDAARQVKLGLNKAWVEALGVGGALNRAKDALPHGLWERWLKEELGWSARAARRYMRYARNLGKLKSAAAADLGTDYLDRLAGLDREVCDEFIERINSGLVPEIHELLLGIAQSKPKFRNSKPSTRASSETSSTPRSGTSIAEAMVGHGTIARGRHNASRPVETSSTTVASLGGNTSPGISVIERTGDTLIEPHPLQGHSMFGMPRDTEKSEIAEPVAMDEAPKRDLSAEARMLPVMTDVLKVLFSPSLDWNQAYEVFRTLSTDEQEDCEARLQLFFEDAKGK
jgi:hypothetical protein